MNPNKIVIFLVDEWWKATEWHSKRSIRVASEKDCSKLIFSECDGAGGTRKLQITPTQYTVVSDMHTCPNILQSFEPAKNVSVLLARREDTKMHIQIYWCGSLYLYCISICIEINDAGCFDSHTVEIL